MQQKIKTSHGMMLVGVISLLALLAIFAEMEKLFVG